MDNTPQYVRMCKEAKEVQEFKRGGRNNRNLYFEKGDWFIHLKSGTVPLDPTFELVTEEITITEDMDNYIWIPNMSQLHECFKNGEAVFTICSIADHWRGDKTYLAKVNDGSGEQLFLAFFMVTRFQKVWNGSKDTWVKRDEE